MEKKSKDRKILGITKAEKAMEHKVDGETKNSCRIRNSLIGIGKESGRIGKPRMNRHHIHHSIAELVWNT